MVAFCQSVLLKRDDDDDDDDDKLLLSKGRPVSKLQSWPWQLATDCDGLPICRRSPTLDTMLILHWSELTC